jgi:hypothetical protein
VKLVAFEMKEFTETIKSEHDLTNDGKGGGDLELVAHVKKWAMYENFDE